MALGTVDFYGPLGSAIYAQLAAPLGSVLYYATAPERTVPPYTVYQFVAPMDDYTFNTAHIEVTVQIESISNQPWPNDARLIYAGTVHPNLQDAPLSVTGFRVLKVRRQKPFQFPDPDRFWHVGADYIVELQAT